MEQAEAGVIPLGQSNSKQTCFFRVVRTINCGQNVPYVGGSEIGGQDLLVACLIISI